MKVCSSFTTVPFLLLMAMHFCGSVLWPSPSSCHCPSIVSHLSASGPLCSALRYLVHSVYWALSYAFFNILGPPPDLAYSLPAHSSPFSSPIASTHSPQIYTSMFQKGKQKKNPQIFLWFYQNPIPKCIQVVPLIAMNHGHT